MENKIMHLFDNDFIVDYFKRNIINKYEDFSEVLNVKIFPKKEFIYKSSYHVVLGYMTTFKKTDSSIASFPIYCTAHSNENRQKVYNNLKFLWDNNFSDGELIIPKPLHYSKGFNATFYEGIDGHTMYYYIKEQNFEELENIIKKTALWFVKLRNIHATNLDIIDTKSSHIDTIIPGTARIFDSLKEKYPKNKNLYNDYKKIYSVLVKRENDFFKSTKERFIVHGDAHPENIIKTEDNKIGVIDFTDLCLSDFARDIGTFLQQLEYMTIKKIDNQDYTKKLKNIFLDNYLKNAKIKMDKDLEKRIDTYYNLTAMRTATYFLIKHEPQPEKAQPLITQTKKNLNIS